MLTDLDKYVDIRPIHCVGGAMGPITRSLMVQYVSAIRIWPLACLNRSHRSVKGRNGVKKASSSDFWQLLEEADISGPHFGTGLLTYFGSAIAP